MPPKKSQGTSIYCVKCQRKTATAGQTRKKTKNGRNAITGKCKVCGTKKFQFTK